MYNSYYDAPTFAQKQRLIDLLQSDRTCMALIYWGCMKVEKGDVVGLTNGVWCKGRFSELIDLAMEDPIEARIQTIHIFAPDFVKAHDTTNL